MTDDYPFTTDLLLLEQLLANRQLADTLASTATLLIDDAPDAEDHVKDVLRQLAQRHPNVLEQMHARLTHQRLVRGGYLSH